MKTSLEFEGPADLSVGEIRISNHKGVEKKWIATHDSRAFKSEDVEPGYYVAEISPAGTRPQSVVFEVKPGIANMVTVPTFSALAANGSSLNFLNVEDREAAISSVYRVNSNAESAPDKMAEFPAELEPETERVAAEASDVFTPPPKSSTPPDQPKILFSDETKLITVGLAIERPGRRESWERFDGPCSAQLTGGQLSIEVGAPPGWTPDSGRRVRMSLAIQDVRVERLLLPLYRGGTGVRITCSPLSQNDVALEILPGDPNIRAIWRALEAGTRDHAAAVRDHVLRVKGPEPIRALETAGPWEAMLAGLLFLRFPEEFGPLSTTWTAELARRFGWAADVHVIRARELASNAGQTPDAVLRSASAAVSLLVRAQARGSPYFNQSNQFFNELVESLFNTGLPQKTHERTERARARWQRESALQRSAGVSFSWLARDPVLLKKGVLAPKRNPSGLLSSRDATVIFKGRLGAGTIAFETLNSEPPKVAGGEPTAFKTAMPVAPVMTDRSDASMPSDCPALARPPGPSDDPNKGRFGGRPEADGFRLSAQFGDDDGKMATVTLRVDADESTTLEIGDSVWLCLHPTFNPEWVKMLFQGNAASLTVKAWGGFTVGAWIPSKNVELECDISQLADAPQIIRDN